MASTRNQVLKLYKSLLRESEKFSSYNFRNYALRKIKDNFKANKSLADNQEISNKLAEGSSNLEAIKRQRGPLLFSKHRDIKVIIGQMYSTDKLVIENVRTHAHA